MPSNPLSKTSFKSFFEQLYGRGETIHYVNTEPQKEIFLQPGRHKIEKFYWADFFRVSSYILS